MGCTLTAMGYVGTFVTGPSLRARRPARQGTYAGWVTPHSLPGPLMGLVTLLLAISVVAMHQLGAGHQPPPSGAGHHATVSVAAHAGAPDVAVSHASPMSSDSAAACATGCLRGLEEPGVNGHDLGLVCLAVLPILVLSLALARRWRALALPASWLLGPRAGKLGGSPRTVMAPRLSPGSLSIRLCVSRT